MPPGDLITDDYQYEFRGLLMGHGTEYMVEGIEGLRSLPDVRNSVIPIQGGHGAVSPKLYYDPRTVQFDIWALAAPNGVDALMDALGAAFALSESADPEIFAFKRPGMTNPRMLFAYPTRASFETDYEFAHGRADGSVELYAPDPLYYSLEEYTDTFTILNGSSSESIVIANAGNFPSSYFRIEIENSITDPIVSSNVYGGQVRMNVAFVNDILTVDFYNHLIKDNDLGVETIEFGYLADDSQWFKLAPGNNTITVNRTGTVGDRDVNVYWRDCWSM